MNGKIELPSYCNPRTLRTSGGENECDHDYPPESKRESTHYVWYRCSKCNMRTEFEVYD
jgi:hypothetical protein